VTPLSGTVRLLAAAVVLTAVLAGCAPGDTEPPATSAPATAAVSTAPSATRTPAASPSTATPTPTPSSTAVTRPETLVEAGTVAGGAPVTVSGSGASTIAFVRDGAFNTVATLDCAGCNGTTVLTGPERGTPFAADTAPYRASVMVEVFADDPPEQELWLQTEGEWTLELRSWNDLEAQYGPVQGDHPAVLLLGDQMDAFDLSCEPLDGDSCHVRAFSAVDTTDLGPDSKLFGDEVAFTEHVELRMPGIVTIRTNGTWSITPAG